MNKVVLAGIAIGALFAIAGVLWLSTSMETLDEIAEQLGVKGFNLWNPLFPDYAVPGHKESVGATLALSLVSIAIVFRAAYLVAKLLIVRREKR